PVMFQVFLLLGTSFATVEDAAHRTDARSCAQRHRPVAFDTEGLRLVLCFAFYCGIRDKFCFTPAQCDRGSSLIFAADRVPSMAAFFSGLSPSRTLHRSLA